MYRLGEVTFFELLFDTCQVLERVARQRAEAASERGERNGGAAFARSVRETEGARPSPRAASPRASLRQVLGEPTAETHAETVPVRRISLGSSREGSAEARRTRERRASASGATGGIWDRHGRRVPARGAVTPRAACAWHSPQADAQALPAEGDATPRRPSQLSDAISEINTPYAAPRC